MRRVLFAVMFLAVSGLMFSEEVVSVKEKKAIDLVEKGVKFFSKNGKEKSFEKFNDPKGEFAEGEFYLFVIGFDGFTVSHGGNKSLIGKNFMELKDPDGFQFQKEILKVAKEKGSGWVNYKWNNPETKKIQPKSTWIKRIPGTELLIGCGFYK